VNEQVLWNVIVKFVCLVLVWQDDIPRVGRGGAVVTTRELPPSSTCPRSHSQVQLQHKQNPLSHYTVKYDN